MGDQRSQVVHEQRLGGRLSDRHVCDQPRCAPLPGLVDDHRAGRRAGGRDVARRADDGGPDPAFPEVRGSHGDPLHRRESPRGQPGRARRRRIPSRADAARSGADPPLHAVARPIATSVRHPLRADKQMVQQWIADSMAEMTAARLMTLQAAWKMDRDGAPAARVEIAMIKYYGATVLYNVIDRAIQVCGSLGFSTDLPLEHMYRAARAARIYDGPDEVHKVTVARQVLKRYKPVDVPTEHVPTRRKAAEARFADMLEAATAAQ